MQTQLTLDRVGLDRQGGWRSHHHRVEGLRVNGEQVLLAVDLLVDLAQ